MSAAIPLIRAAADGDVGAVKELLAGGADVNVRTPLGDTALIRAAFFGRAEVVRVLLDAGADARARDGNDFTAYEWAVRKGFYPVARYSAKTRRRSRAGPWTRRRLPRVGARRQSRGR